MLQLPRALAVLCLWGLAQGGVAAPSPLAAGGVLRVFAAASLKGPLDEVLSDWREAGGSPVQIAYAGSPALVRQIEQGAPVDLFISADALWMDRLASGAWLRAGTRRDLLGNALVLIGAGPATAGATIAVLGGGDWGRAQALPLRASGRVALSEVNSVPAGRYAKAALEALGLWVPWSAHLAMTDNVRAALALVARGEASLGIVYASDAALEPRVRVIARFAADCHPPIVYPAAVLARAVHPQAEAALRHLSEPVALARFERAGFHRPPSDPLSGPSLGAGCRP